MNNNFLWDPKKESRDAFLQRGALILDDINNGVHPQGNVSLQVILSEPEKQEVRDYIFSVMHPVLKKTGEILAKKWRLGASTDNFLNQFYIDVWSDAHKYNNKHYTKSTDSYLFRTFASIYAPGALRKVKAEELGISRGMYYKLKAVEKTRNYISERFGVSRELITDEEISRYISVATSVDIKIGEISVIQRAAREKFSIDAYENGEENFAEANNVAFPDEGVRRDLEEFFEGWSWVRKFIFCQNYSHCSKRYENLTLKQLASDKYFVLLCEEDEKAKNHVEIGDLVLDRYYDSNDVRRQDGIKFENIHFVKTKFIGNQRALLRDQFTDFVFKKNYDEEDLSTNLFDLMNEMWDELSDHMIELERRNEA